MSAARSAGKATPSRAALAGVLWCLCACPGARAADFPDSAAIVRELRAFVEVHRGAPGVVLGVIDSAGRRVFAFGESGRPERRRLDGTTRFEIGSITKTFTGILMAEMLRAGEVSAGDRVADLFPNTIALNKDVGEITLEQLATHTSGLPRLALDLPSMSRTLSADPYRGRSAREIFLSVSRARLHHSDNLAYSNLGFALLGRLLERRAGHPYEELLRRRILEPRGLGGIATAHSARPEVEMARGHGRGGQPAPYWHLDGYAPAGCLIASTDELLEYLKLNLAGKDSAAAEAQRLRRTFPKGNGIGLAWMHSKVAGRRLIWHNGGTGGFRSFAGFLPDEGRGVVVLANGQGDVDELARRLLDPARPPLPAHRASASGIWMTLVMLAWGPLLMAMSLRQAARSDRDASAAGIPAPVVAGGEAPDPGPRPARSGIDRFEVLRRALSPAIALVLAERMGAWLEVPFIVWWGALALTVVAWGALLWQARDLPWFRGGAWSMTGRGFGAVLEVAVLAALLS